MRKVPSEDSGIRTQWRAERIGRLGLLIGLGWDVQTIAEDPLIKSTKWNVYRKAQRLGLSIQGAAMAMPLRLPTATIDQLRPHAERRNMTVQGLVKALTVIIAADPSLVDNVLDDQA